MKLRDGLQQSGIERPWQKDSRTRILTFPNGTKIEFGNENDFDPLKGADSQEESGKEQK